MRVEQRTHPGGGGRHGPRFEQGTLEDDFLRGLSTHDIGDRHFVFLHFSEAFSVFGSSKDLPLLFVARNLVLHKLRTKTWRHGRMLKRRVLFWGTFHILVCRLFRLTLLPNHPAAPLFARLSYAGGEIHPHAGTTLRSRAWRSDGWSKWEPSKRRKR